MDSGSPGKPSAGSFAPLRQPVFAVLWTATVLGNTGVFMRDVASAWLATELSASPAAAALVQTAATLPIFLFALVAGVLSDILDRRRLLIGIQLLLASGSGCLLLLAQTGLLTVDALVLLTFVGGIGAALMGPTWQSIVPGLVRPSDLRHAVALNSLGINIARALGPAAGGLLLTTVGAPTAYGAHMLSCAAVIAALVWWRPPAPRDTSGPEKFMSAFRAGLRYCGASRELHVVLLRAAAFFLFASSVWALLAPVARQMPEGTAHVYGLLLGAVGVGAIVGALLLPKLRDRLDADGLMLAASMLSAGVMAGLSCAPPKWAAMLLMTLLGVAWIVALTTLNGAAQAVLPNWVRGRGLAIYLMAFNGAMAGGSLAWGLVAQQVGVLHALLISAVGLVVTAIAFNRIRLPAGEDDLKPARHWPEPTLNTADTHARGSVVVQIEYRVRSSDRQAFLRAMRGLARSRRRNGAYAWTLAAHTTDPSRVIEWFMVESWAEHLRQHDRVSKADAELQAQVLRFHLGPDKPAVHHFLTMNPKSGHTR